MKREIEFRGKPIGKGGIWMVGIGAYKSHTSEHLVLNAKGDSVEVVHLCQYTRLKDKNGIKSNLRDFVKTDLNSIIENRIESHKAFIKVRQDAGLSVKHHNLTYDVGVVTKQESNINFGTILNIVEDNSNNLFRVDICYV